MSIYENENYRVDLEYVCELDLPWNQLEDKTIMISGATGLIGSCLIDVLMYKNISCKIVALGRNVDKARNRFSYCWNSEKFKFIQHDVNMPFSRHEFDNVDYVLHLASNTHPMQYSMDPIGTITTNIIGIQNMLEYAAENKVIRCVFASSNEIYGENRGDIEKFDESYCGYIDCNTLRAGYPESKRCGEALCQAYIKQKDLDIVIPRLTRSYGPTLLSNDTKALSQFIHKGIKGEDIVLKSEGTQYYSYLHVIDSVSGLITVLLNGKCGEAYNISDEKSDIRLKDLAKIIAKYSGTKVVFELPDEVERAGYSRATKARLDNSKIKDLGWSAKYDIEKGIISTLNIIKEI